MTRFTVSVITAGAMALSALAPAIASAGDVDPGESRLIAAGQMALEQGKTDFAIRLLRAGVRETMKPDLRAAGHASLCAAYNVAEEPRKALRYCDKALRLDSENWKALNDRGLAHLALGHPQAAAADFDRALSLNPDDKEIAANLRHAQSQIRQLASTEQDD